MLSATLLHTCIHTRAPAYHRSDHFAVYILTALGRTKRRKLWKLDLVRRVVCRECFVMNRSKLCCKDTAAQQRGIQYERFAVSSMKEGSPSHYVIGFSFHVAVARNDRRRCHGEKASAVLDRPSTAWKIGNQINILRDIDAGRKGERAHQ